MTRNSSPSPAGDSSNSQSNQGGAGDRNAFEKIEDDLQSEAAGRSRASAKDAADNGQNPAGEFAANDQPLPGKNQARPEDQRKQ